jgi:UDP-3-O-[3-hydroxymyristoyl] N-acetylglucosamine deacetylase/UDP-3-O-[3-hydroxymyristoyl] N-acetylglucosamine deacetylase/3-hydroxyacyl-[acyl-carrier-protein] dehydratase
MSQRRQTTLQNPATIRGSGLFGGADVTLEFRPAPEFHGIVFQRIDLSDLVRIPARIEYVVPRPRRTAIARLGVTVEVVEHVLAALAGLQVDNCLVRLDAPEVPNGDGSARAFVDALLQAGIMDYGPSSPITRQALCVYVTPDVFVREIAFARTFVLESEIAALRAAGMGLKTTARDLLVFGQNGRPIGNILRAEDECVRHKVLDCIGDFALAGCDLCGEFRAVRSGHQQNHDLLRKLVAAQAARQPRAASAAAAA